MTAKWSWSEAFEQIEYLHKQLLENTVEVEGGKSVVPSALLHYLDEDIPKLKECVQHIVEAYDPEQRPTGYEAESWTNSMFLYMFLKRLGLDMDSQHLEGTPQRLASTFEELLTRAEDFHFTTFDTDYKGLIVENNITFYSMCAHHLLPFFGIVHIGYIPHGRLAGLSKLARAVEYFAREPQIQEEMTQGIVDLIETELEPAGIAVVIQAEHLCMSMRGAHKPGHLTTTSVMKGQLLLNPAAREEFFELVALSKRT